MEYGDDVYQGKRAQVHSAFQAVVDNLQVQYRLAITSLNGGSNDTIDFNNISRMEWVLYRNCDLVGLDGDTNRLQNLVDLGQIVYSTETFHQMVKSGEVEKPENFSKLKSFFYD